jgi:hypothetical protein
MENELLKELLNIGGNAGVMWVALWFLLKILKQQYDLRITALEGRSDSCEEDRKNLHQQIHALQNERIALLENLLSGRKPSSVD